MYVFSIGGGVILFTLFILAFWGQRPQDKNGRTDR